MPKSGTLSRPVSVCRSLGATLVIAVNLNADISEPGFSTAASDLAAGEESAILSRMKNLPGTELAPAFQPVERRAQHSRRYGADDEYRPGPDQSLTPGR